MEKVQYLDQIGTAVHSLGRNRKGLEGFIDLSFTDRITVFKIIMKQGLLGHRFNQEEDESISKEKWLQRTKNQIDDAFVFFNIIGRDVPNIVSAWGVSTPDPILIIFTLKPFKEGIEEIKTHDPPDSFG